MSDEKDPFSSGYDPTAGYQFGLPQSPGVVPYAEPEPDKKSADDTAATITPAPAPAPAINSQGAEIQYADVLGDQSAFSSAVTNQLAPTQNESATKSEVKENERESAFDRAILRFPPRSSESGLIARAIDYYRSVQKQISEGPFELQPFIRKDVKKNVALSVASLICVVFGWLIFSSTFLLTVFLLALFAGVYQYFQTLSRLKTFTWLEVNAHPKAATAFITQGFARTSPAQFLPASKKGQGRYDVVSITLAGQQTPIPPVRLIWQSQEIAPLWGKKEPCEVFLLEETTDSFDRTLRPICVIVKLKDNVYFGETNKLLYAED